MPSYSYGGYDPFRYGHWQRVGFGWSWFDPTPWGFYTFHRGHWAYLHHRNRWCWVPEQDHHPWRTAEDTRAAERHDDAPVATGRISQSGTVAAGAFLKTVVCPAADSLMRWNTMYAHVDMKLHGRLVSTHTLVVSGGITEYYLRDQLWYWVRDLERIRNEVRKQLRLVLGQTVH